MIDVPPGTFFETEVYYNSTYRMHMGSIQCLPLEFNIIPEFQMS